MKKSDYAYIGTAFLATVIVNLIFQKKHRETEKETEELVNDSVDQLMASVREDMAKDTREKFNSIIKEI